MTTVASARGNARETVSRMRWEMLSNGRDLTDRLGLLARLEHLRALPSDCRRAKHAEAKVARLLESLGERAADGGPIEPWRAHQMLRTSSGLTILTAGPVHGPFKALIKIAATEGAADRLDWQRKTLLSLREDARLREWRRFLPRVLAAGATDGIVYVVEERIPGANLQFALADSDDHSSVLLDAGAAVSELHRATASEAVVGPEILDRWVMRPISALTTGIGRSNATRAAQGALARLARELCASLEGRTVTTSWVHGDYSPGNILTGPDDRVSGIVDWEFAYPHDLPALDVVTLLLTSRMAVRRQELGQVVCDILARPLWSDAERSLAFPLDGTGIGGGISIETVVLMCWLRHVARMITRHHGYIDKALWIHGNVGAVLDSLAGARFRVR